MADAAIANMQMWGYRF